MKILLLTQWFDPEPTMKGMMFARELRARGHAVHVITGFPNYPGGHVYPGYRIRPFQSELHEGVRVWRVPLYPSHDQSGVRRAINYGTFAVSAALAALVVPRPDVAYSYHPPATIGLPSLVMRRLRRVPVVYDIQDLWPDTLRATGMVHNPVVLRAVAQWMKLLYANATHIVVLSPGFKRRLVDLGVPGARVSVIPNWAHEEDEEPLPASGDRAPVEGVDQTRFNVVFAGTMGRAQDLGVVLEAARLLRDSPDIQFVMVGGGIESERLTEEAATQGLHNVRFLGRRPAEEMPTLFAAADCLLVHLRKDPLFEITIPSKTQSYMRAGRPILMGVEGDAGAMVRESGGGLVFEPGNAQALADAVATLRAAPVETRKAMGRGANDYYAAKLGRRTGVTRFVEIFQEAAETTGASKKGKGRDESISGSDAGRGRAPLAGVPRQLFRGVRHVANRRP